MHAHDQTLPHRPRRGVTSPDATVKSKPKMSWGMRANLAFSALVICLGPVLMVAGTAQINADAELVRMGVRVPGTITEFHDQPQASDRKMKVEFQSADGSVHGRWITVDFDQHPAAGEEVTVVYQESDPGRATAIGYESDGVFYRGVGTVLTSIFGGIAVCLAGCYWLGRRRDRREPAS
jgi:hypothetical protein